MAAAIVTAGLAITWTSVKTLTDNPNSQVASQPVSAWIKTRQGMLGLVWDHQVVSYSILQYSNGRLRLTCRDMIPAGSPFHERHSWRYSMSLSTQTSGRKSMLVQDGGFGLGSVNIKTVSLKLR